MRVISILRASALVLAVGLSSVISVMARQQVPQPEPDLAPWVEPDFPFYSSVLDARKAGAALPATNLSPRALVLNLGDGLWAAFDPDLLRVTFEDRTHVKLFLPIGLMLVEQIVHLPKLSLKSGGFSG